MANDPEPAEAPAPSGAAPSPLPRRPPLRVLLIDDEKNIRATLALCLENLGHGVKSAANGEAALRLLGQQPFDVAFLDLRLGSQSGLELLPQLLAAAPGLAVVIITAYATIDTAVEAMRRGAADYLAKPFTPAQIRIVVERLSERLSLQGRVVALEEQLRRSAPEVELDTAAPAMQAVHQTVMRAAAAHATVLLRGENGTGKGVLARALHVHSARRAAPFIVVNCPTLSEELLASELFGHQRGAFTGAVRDQPGRVEAAEGGTLFLDEIGELSPGLQAKLLRFLQDKEFERVGDARTRRADVRILAATNRDLEADVRAGRFREDLLYRLNVVEICVPPLRQRPEDILPLARRFLALFAAAVKRLPLELSPKVEAVLLAYPWPGNIRELRNVMERATILSPSQLLELSALPERLAAHSEGGLRLGGDATLEAIEREHILRVLGRARSQEEAAHVLGIDSSTLWRKRKRYEEGG